MVLRVPDYNVRAVYGVRPAVSVEVTRDTFAADRERHMSFFLSHSLHSFDAVKTNVLARRDREIAGVRAEIKAQEERFYGWKQTARWAADTADWEQAA